MKSFVVLDLETNGVDPQNDDIVEIGIAVVEDYEVVREYQTFVRPLKPMPVFVEKLTGIKDADLEGAPSFEEVRSQVEELIGDLPIVGHNIEFDISFLKQKGVAKHNSGLDTWELSTMLLPEIKYFSLEYLSWHFNFPSQPSHRALDDVLANVYLVKLLVSRLAELPQGLREKFIELAARSKWDWQVLFDNDLPKFTFTPRKDNEAGEVSQPLALDQVKEQLIGQVNFINLPADRPANAAALELADHFSPSMLMVGAFELRAFESDAKARGIHILGSLSFDQVNFDQLLAMPRLDIAELRLLLKLLLWMEMGHDPSRDLPYLTRDEIHLWQRRLTGFKQAERRPEKQLTTFHYWWEEIKASDPETTLIVTSPEKFIFDIIESGGFRLTLPLLEGSVASRRDFVATLQGHGLHVDELFKHLAKAGETNVELADSLSKFYATRHTVDGRGYPEDLLLGEWMYNSPEGAKVKSALEILIQSWEAFASALEALKLSDAWLIEYAAHQAARAQLHIQRLKTILSLPVGYLFYLENYNNRPTLKVVKSQIGFEQANLLKGFKKIVFIGNGISSTLVSQFEKYFGLGGNVIEVQAQTVQTVELITKPWTDSEWHNLLAEGPATLMVSNSKTKMLEFWEDLYRKFPETKLECKESLHLDISLADFCEDSGKVALTYRDIEGLPNRPLPHLAQVILTNLPYEPFNQAYVGALGVGQKDEFEALALPQMAAALVRLVAKIKVIAPAAEIKVMDPKLGGYLDKVQKLLPQGLVLKAKV
jgi:DNA polymerase III epsilon subunit-like protein